MMLASNSERLIIHCGDALTVLRTMSEASVHCCVTSPPYWGLRDYGVAGQLGLEPTIGEFVLKIRDVFAEVRRVLRDDGTCWLNLGDSYAYDSKWGGVGGCRHTAEANGADGYRRRRSSGLGPKNICGIPWRVAFALQESGWTLRQDLIWHKPTAMPESVQDRCTKAHEYLFLLTNGPRYYWDREAILEPVSGNAHPRRKDTPAGWAVGTQSEHTPMALQRNGVHRKSAAPGSGIKANDSFSAAVVDLVSERNKRSVWTVPSVPYKEAHFACYPPDLIKPCILAGCPPAGTVLDPFAGSGTTGAVAIELGRKAVMIELNPEYVRLIRQRCDITPGFEFSTPTEEAK